MGNTFYFGWEVKLMEWIQSLIGSGFFVSLASIITMLGEQMICVAVLGFFYWGYNKELGKKIGINITVNIVWNPLIKNIFSRRRPYFDNEGIKILKPVDADADIYDIAAQGYSFPSGHSSNSATLYGTLARFAKGKWLKAVLVAITVLVGFSRVMLGAHYPTDVLCGWGLGLIIVFFVPFLEKKIKNKYVFYAVLLISGIPGFFYCTSNDFYTGYGLLLGAILGFIFEEKRVQFDETKNILRCILRTVGGAAFFLGLNEVFKLPFSSEFLDSGTFAAFFVRTVRYAIVAFLICGVYPMIFKYTAKLWRKNK